MTTVTTARHGEVEGVQREGYVSFKGIPYAAPPIGERRWLPPQPVNPWSGTLRAESYGFVAPQPERVADAPLAMLGTEIGEEREDCLYLNVWTPAIDDRKRPVMVWIHGGGFRSGTGGSPLYSPRFMVRRGDVVVVTVNYRLGALGFLNLNEVTRGRIPSTGNEGLLDQIAALRWVRDNIAVFGGDPDQVTVFGESAGGMSVGALLGAPAARGLFQRAIPQSGAASTARTLERAAYVAERFLEKLGLQPHDCDGLRALDPRRLIEVEQELSLPVDPLIGGIPCEPVIDGQVLPQLPLDAVRAGSADGVSLLVGSTLDEWRLFLAMDPRGRKLDESGLAQRLNRRVADADLRPLAEAYRRAREARGEDTLPRLRRRAGLLPCDRAGLRVGNPRPDPGNGAVLRHRTRGDGALRSDPGGLARLCTGRRPQLRAPGPLAILHQRESRDHAAGREVRRRGGALRRGEARLGRLRGRTDARPSLRVRPID